MGGFPIIDGEHGILLASGFPSVQKNNQLPIQLK